MNEILIVALGDSITNGAGISDVTEIDTYRHHLQVDLSKMTGNKINVTNAGINGDITTTAISRIENDVLKFNPNYVTIMFGVNDAGFYRPATDSMADTPRVFADDFKANIKYIISLIKDINSIPILVTPLPMNGNYAHKDFPPYAKYGLNYLVDEYSDIIRKISIEEDIHLIDVNKVFNDDSNTQNLISDGIHPNKCGHRFIADLFIAKFIELLKGE